MTTDYLLSIDLGTKNFAYCLLNVKKERIVKWDCIELATSTKETHERVCTSLANKLDELQLTRLKRRDSTSLGPKSEDLPDNPEKKKNIIIVVELQPKTNIRTTVLSGQVQMYYVLEKLSESDLDNSFCHIEKIVGYHARNKLRYYEPQEGDEPLDLSHIKKGYYKNKRTAKEHCKRVLVQKGEKEKWLNLFGSSKKKDDISDAYLQALAYKKFVMKLGDNPERYPKKEKKTTTSKKTRKSKKSKKSTTSKKTKSTTSKKTKSTTSKKTKSTTSKKTKSKKSTISKKTKKIITKCQATTKKGTPCKYSASVGDFCKRHS